MTLRDAIRKYPWPVGLAALVVALLAVNGWLWLHLDSARERVVRERATLTRMQEFSGQYAARMAQSAPDNIYLKNRAALSLSAVQDMAKRKGILGLVREPKLRPIKHEQGLLEQVVTLTIRSVHREDLSGFVYAVESLDPAIRTKELRIAPAKDRPKLVDARLTFSAYEAPPIAK